MSRSGDEAKNYGATEEVESVGTRPPARARQDSNCGSSSSKEANSVSDFGSVVTPSVRSLKVGGRFGSIHSLSGLGGSVAGDEEEYLEEEDLESGLGRRRSQHNDSFSDMARYRRAMRHRRGRSKGSEDGLSIASSASSTRRSISVSPKGTDRLSNANTLLEKVGEERQCAPHIFVWGIPGALCATSYALYNVFIKLGSYSISPVLGGVILQFVACLLGVGLLFFDQRKSDRDVWQELKESDRVGIMWCVGAGLAVGSAEMLSFYVSSLGVAASQSIPVIIGGSVVFDVILGVLFLSESFGLKAMIGVPVVVAGICSVASSVTGAEGSGVTIAALLGFDGSALAANETIELELVDWIGPAIACAMAYALYNVFIKKGSDTMNPVLGGVILQIVAMILGSSFLGIFLRAGFYDVLRYDMKGILWACLAGLSVGTAEILSFYVSSLGVPVSISTSTVVGGSVVLGSMIGWIALGDIITFGSGFGVLFVLCGVVSVAMDAGDHDEDAIIADDANATSKSIGGDGNIEQYNVFFKKVLDQEKRESPEQRKDNDANIMNPASEKKNKYIPAIDSINEEGSMHRPSSPMLIRFLEQSAPEGFGTDPLAQENLEDYYFGKPFAGLSSDSGIEQESELSDSRGGIDRN
jgi:transporter family protein